MPPAIKDGYMNPCTWANAKKMLKIPPIIPSNPSTPLMIKSPIAIPMLRRRFTIFRCAIILEAAAATIMFRITVIYFFELIWESNMPSTNPATENPATIAHGF